MISPLRHSSTTCYSTNGRLNDERNKNVNPAEIIQEFYRRMNTNDFSLAAQMLSDDFVLEWPQSRERIRGRDNFAAVNTEYPASGPWRFTMNRLVASEIEAVSDVSVSDGVLQARVITFSTVQEGKITRQVEFWPENYEPPQNRRHLVELME